MERRNNYDVTNRVNTTDPAAVNGEINRIFVKLYPKASTRVLNRSFKDLVRLHLGEYPGYRASDTGYHNLQHTLKHVTRGARFLAEYLTKLGLAKLAPAASRVIHFTGYERPALKIRVPNPTFRLLGNMLGTADIIAQMADRCYLEKCRDRLFLEFVEGGLAARDKA